MLKLTVNKASCKVEVDYYLKGSVLKETIESGCTGCRVHFVVDSPETPENIERVIRLAKRGCYAERLVETPVPVTSTYEVNGQVTTLQP